MLVFADRRTKWKYVQWTTQACAHPTVRISRLAFALRDAQPLTAKERVARDATGR